MVQAQLLGKHTHCTANGAVLNIWQRGDRFIARGSYESHRIGPTLGTNEQEAETTLRHIMVAMDNGAYLRPSDPQSRRQRKISMVPNLSIAQLVDRFVQDKRDTKGAGTARDYSSRLTHVVAFAERPDVRRRYPLAMNLDRTFALELRAFLQQRMVAPNGHANSQRRPMSARHIRNVLEAVRETFNWAKGSNPPMLPTWFIQPFTPDIMGKQARKDPLRRIVYPLERRRRLVLMSDKYQLVTLSILYLLPLRPEQLSGLLIPEIDWVNRTMRFGSRFGEADYTKGGTSFTVPFPDQLAPLLRSAVCGRAEGPVFLRRSVFDGSTLPRIRVVAAGDMEATIQQALMSAKIRGSLPPGDAKDVCRQAIVDAGGVTPDQMAQEFQKLIGPAGIDEKVRFYDLRGSVDSEMQRVGIPTEFRRYLMGHEELAGGSLDHYESFDIEDLRRSMMMHQDFAREIIDAIVARGQHLSLW